MLRTILFVGGGNMTRAIVAGLIQNGYKPDLITVMDRNEEKRAAFEQEFKVHSAAESSFAQVIVLAVKPQDAAFACTELRSKIAGKSPIILSIMAAVTVAKLKKWLGKELHIVRAMPNTPSAIGMGATGLFTEIKTNLEAEDSIEKRVTSQIMAAVGTITWVEKEEDLDTIVALSGSAPAYYFLFMELMAEIASEWGIDQLEAKRFAIETARGSAELAARSKEGLETLRSQVTSRGGTTAEALRVMEQLNLKDLLKEAMDAARKRSREISKSL